MRDYWHLWLGALFLKTEAYDYQRARRDSFAHGVAFIALLGVIVALFGIAGAGLRFAAEPNADAIKNVILTHVQALPFYTQLAPGDEKLFLTRYNEAWENFGGALLGYPINSTGVALLFSSVVTTPLFWIISWLIYGTLAHWIARSASPTTSLTHGLGTLALATSPQLLRVVELFPGANVSLLLIGVWAMVCNVYALHRAYRLAPMRAVLAALVPLIIMVLLLVILIFIIVALRGGRA